MTTTAPIRSTTRSTQDQPKPTRRSSPARRIIPARWHNPINRALNYALYLVLCFMIGTGLLLWIRLPPGQGRHRGGTHDAILGLTRHEWGDWHLAAGLSFIALCVIHLLMNLTWLRKIAAGAHPVRFWIGIAIGLACIALLWFVPTDS
jgi:hypothetical protein